MTASGELTGEVCPEDVRIACGADLCLASARHCLIFGAKIIMPTDCLTGHVHGIFACMCAHARWSIKYLN